MSIVVKNASLSFSKTLFEDISFNLRGDDRVGLVGDNGSGKSTLLRALAGLESLQSGEIHHPGGALVGYLHQDVPVHLRGLTLYEVIELAIPEAERSYSGYKIDMLLEAFAADEHIAFNTLDQLSGGWQRIAMLGRTMMDDPAVLLLDEPTNHLDLSKIVLLESWLLKLNIPYIVISHDRAFLDAVTKRTLFLRAGKIHDFAQPYSSARTLLAEEDTRTAKIRLNQEREAERLRKSAADLRRKGTDHFSDSLKQRAKKMQQRAEQVVQNFVPVYIPPKRTIDLGVRDMQAKTLIRLQDYAVTKPDGALLYIIKQMDVRQGDRIAILGANGTGKSQFLRLLVRDLQRAQAGECIKGAYFTPSIALGYLDQLLANLPHSSTLIDYVCTQYALEQQSAIQHLIDVGFGYYEQAKAIGDLSFGERTRLALMEMRLQAPNLYVLDEPSNHLDLDGQDRLEVALMANTVTTLLVSHDRRLIDTIPNRFFEIQRKRLNEVKSPAGFYQTVTG